MSFFTDFAAAGRYLVCAATAVPSVGFAPSAACQLAAVAASAVMSATTALRKPRHFAGVEKPAISVLSCVTSVP